MSRSLILMSLATYLTAFALSVLSVADASAAQTPHQPRRVQAR